MNDELKKCFETIKALRDPKTGCPWDLEQDHKSLVKYMIEESYECADAINKGQKDHIKDELGDVLLQVFLHSVIAEQNNDFSIADVANNLREKIIRRHPHVFSNPEQKKISADEVTNNWQKIKANEKSGQGSSRLKEWKHLPALLASYKIGEATNKVKFDWEDHHQVGYKVEEEWQELKEELMSPSLDTARVKEEIGDLLFSLAQLARHLKIEPEDCLNSANQKFSRRFKKMEELISKANLNMDAMNQEEMDVFWNQVKTLEKGE